jgi:hypothetical protein
MCLYALLPRADPTAWSGPACPLHQNTSAGELARRVDSRRDIPGYLVHRGYAPVPAALILGRTAVLHVVLHWRRSIPSLHHRRKPASCRADKSVRSTRLALQPGNMEHGWGLEPRPGNRHAAKLPRTSPLTEIPLCGYLPPQPTYNSNKGQGTFGNGLGFRPEESNLQLWSRRNQAVLS